LPTCELRPHGRLPVAEHNLGYDGDHLQRQVSEVCNRLVDGQGNK
jgi:hypothetical protein